jgi:hypothetical protein
MEEKTSAQYEESKSTSVLKTTFVTKRQAAALMQVLDPEELEQVSGGRIPPVPPPCDAFSR